MFMKTRQLIIDSQLKKNCTASKLMKNRKKHKRGHTSGLGNPFRKIVRQNFNGIVKEGKVLISGSCKKGVSITRNSKRKLSSVLRKAVRGRKKRKMEIIDQMDEIVEPVDRISELPEPIIHHILSFLRCPKDVTRTTVWSKKWRSLWASFFTFDFDQKKFKTSGGNHIQKFITFVNISLATKLEPVHSIQKFKISLSKASIKLIYPMNNWITAAMIKDVKELEIHVEEDNLKRHYLLPHIVLTSNNLTSLKLYGCKFDDTVIINLRNIKELSIKNAHVNTDLINNFIQGCPSVEDLRLIHCKGIGHLHISTLLKLHTVQLHECHGLVSVDIELTSLVSFLHWVKNSWICSLNLVGCENLKYLSVKDPNLTDKLFQDLIIEFPSLQKVVLRECLHEAKLHLLIRKNSVVVLRELELFLQKFLKNGAWKLIVSSNKNITIHEELPKFQHLSSKELKLELVKSPMKLRDFVDNLLRMTRPKTLSLVSSSSSELLNFLKEKILSREKYPRCCTYYVKKCWLHYIKDVTMVVPLEGAEGEDTCHNLQQQTTFIFNWQSLESEQLAL
ncbi:hypothetical protein E3N88_21411 [Mikania micrantha]|uniref:At1g61320/AtMIF1 LRR domain-containing protein n=1 Tax=Mikania micrantha TaxID=192012 RepID=A0A5N6NMJ7_9ASTR|nr:hypothetical protein E3N88_21411 [Mikania micrantha]